MSKDEAQDMVHPGTEEGAERAATRPRGRPRKAAEDVSHDESDEAFGTPEKKKRGRLPKPSTA
ncbi:hypothetical protein ACWDQ0_36900 [Streptomyces sp. NPDC003642]